MEGKRQGFEELNHQFGEEEIFERNLVPKRAIERVKIGGRRYLREIFGLREKR